MAGEAIFMRCVEAMVDGVKRKVFIAADEESAAILSDRKIKVGEQVAAMLRQDRDAEQWRRAHALGGLLSLNIDELAGLSSHAALKKLQARAGVECDESIIRGVEFVCPECACVMEIPDLVALTPRSIGFEAMPQGKFNEVYSAIKRYVVQNYWTECTEADVDAMVVKMLNGAGGA